LCAINDTGASQCHYETKWFLYCCYVCDCCLTNNISYELQECLWSISIPTLKCQLQCWISHHHKTHRKCCHVALKSAKLLLYTSYIQDFRLLPWCSWFSLFWDIAQCWGRLIPLFQDKVLVPSLPTCTAPIKITSPIHQSVCTHTHTKWSTSTMVS
jgi:hypothetical protein